MKSFFNKLSQFNVKRNVSLSSYNTFKINSIAKTLIEVSSNEIINLLEILKKHKKDFILLGAGSNTIFKDKIVKKIVVVLIDRGSIRVKRNCITCAAGERLANVVNFYLKNEYEGFEWAVGIPASVGGAVCMNAGAFGKSISDNIKSVIYYDGDNIKKIHYDKCEFSYRQSLFKRKKYIVLFVEFMYKKANGDLLLEKTKEYMLIRKQKQPNEASAGSVFKNGESFKAGEMIEKLGLKGKCVGGAMVSYKHANFIVNKGGASGKQVVKLIKEIKNLAKIKYNATLCEEVVIQ